MSQSTLTDFWLQYIQDNILLSTDVVLGYHPTQQNIQTKSTVKQSNIHIRIQTKSLKNFKPTK